MAAFRPSAAAPSEEQSRPRPTVLDEFTAPAERSALLERSRGCIERLFGVRLAFLEAGGGGGGGVGGWAPSAPGGRRIWLSLLGEREEVRSAKEYIKGICEPELEEREYYPKDMHCIFVGAQNLFLNCLIQGTSADITVVEIGTLGIKGRTEPVVMARSHIQQLVNLFKSNLNELMVKESEVKKQFKHLVEAHADKYTMDLLILPSSLKKELLGLTQHGDQIESRIADPGSSHGMLKQSAQIQKQSVVSSDGKTGQEEARNNAGTPVSELAKQMDTVFPDTPEGHFLPINGLTSLEASASKERQSCKRRSSNDDERLPKKQFSFETNQECKPIPCKKHNDIVVIDLVSDTNDSLDTKNDDEISEEMEYKILVNFFKSMGYSEEIVETVIVEHGPLAEPLLLLEEIVKKSKTGVEEEVKTRAVFQNIETQAEKYKGGSGIRAHQNLGCKSELSQNANVASVSPALCKTGDKIRGSDAENRIALLGNKNSLNKEIGKIRSGGSEQGSKASDVESDGFVTTSSNAHMAPKDKKPKDPILVARGGWESAHPPVQKEIVVLRGCPHQASVKQDQQENCNPGQLGAQQFLSQKSKHFADSTLPLQLRSSYPEKKMGGPYCHPADPSVTGVQRFLEALKTPYKLELKNEPGRPHLKYVVIDGSNVAISHGLQKFFSCRGIAIAVDYFWKRGHRKITVFVPQWRTRKDSNITEQHFLTELQDVGILALTPARIVCGARIASHDDRFLLHLAEKTGGVIVTNDNFREFVDESPTWREIIQRRLLQYTFAGDIFMVPDDPLGRNGPGLDHFLQEEASFRAMPTQYRLASGSHLPFGLPSFQMQSEGSGQLTPNPVSGLLPNLPLFPTTSLANSVLPPSPRSATETTHLKEALKKIFPTSEQREKIEQILAQHPHMRDMNALSALVLDLS